MNSILNSGRTLMDYPYFLITCVLMIFFASGLLVIPKRHRLPMLLSALMSTPFSLASFLFDPDYWHPVRIIEYPVGIEDFVFSFSTGGLVWFFAVWPLHRKICFNLKAGTIIRRNITYVLFGSLMYVIFRYNWFDVMTAVLISAVLLTLHVLYLRRDLWSVWLCGFTGFTLFYLLLIKISFVFFPDSIHLWNTHALWGYYPWGVPLEELAWAGVFGGGWPVVTAYVFNGSPCAADSGYRSAGCS
ncbi:MAG: hypothetical protein AB1499_06290 [Nitrospirota bacterium]